MSKKRANGEGSIYYNSQKKLYIGQIVIGYDANGKQKRKSVSGKNPSEVRQKIKQLEYQIFSGEFVDESNITIYHLAMQMQNEKLNFNEITEGTYYRNLEMLKRLKRIYLCPLQKANETQIKAFFEGELDYSQSTLEKEYRLLKAIFDEAIKRKIITESPMKNIRQPKSKKQTSKVRALTVDEQTKLIKILMNENIRYGLQMLIALYTGMRMGEVNALTVKDINFTFNTISINKTITRGEKGKAILNNTTKTEAGRRTIKINAEIKPLLQEYVAYLDREFLFLTPNGNYINTNEVNMVLARMKEKYGFVDSSVYGKITCHSLRHTYATRCIEGGMPAKVLQMQLGHRDITTTMNTYCDAFEQYENKYNQIVNDYMREQGLTLTAV